MPISLFKGRRVSTGNGVVWSVKVTADKHLDMAFHTKHAALQYKEALANSHRKLEATIQKQTFTEGYVFTTDV